MKIENIKIIENHIDDNSLDKIDEEDIKSFFGLITGFTRNYINTLVSNYQIKLPIGDSVDLRDVSLYQEDTYIYADVTPKIDIE